MPRNSSDLLFVTAVSSWDTLQRRLLSSPCLQSGRYPLVARWNASSAAQALNPVLDTTENARWIVWVHQDVVLPAGWDSQFLQQAESAATTPGPAGAQALGIVGVYGVQGCAGAARHAGRVLDRGHWLQGPADLPCNVDSLDELLFALPAGSPLRLDAALGFDLYATDLVLQAQERQLRAAVIDAPCEHWSGTPSSGSMPSALVERVARSGDVFEAKWLRRLPVSTPAFQISRLGDVRRLAQALANP